MYNIYLPGISYKLSSAGSFVKSAAFRMVIAIYALGTRFGGNYYYERFWAEIEKTDFQYTYCIHTTIRNVASYIDIKIYGGPENMCHRWDTVHNHKELPDSETLLGWNPTTGCIIFHWVLFSGLCRKKVCWRSSLGSLLWKDYEKN